MTADTPPLDLHVAAAIAEARSRGYAVGERLGVGGYTEAWAVGNELVMRIPRVRSPRHEHPDAVEHGHGPLLIGQTSDTGPFDLFAVPDLTTATEILDAAVERQEKADGPPLARLVERLRLAGRPATLHARARGRSLQSMTSVEIRAALPAVAKAIGALHERFGFHGDLKPAHVFVDRQTVTLIDPLDARSPGILIGSVGYSLPLFPRTTSVHDETLLLRDVGSLAAIAAEAHGADLGWTNGFTHGLANRHNGRFGGVTAASWRAMTREKLASVEPAMRTWLTSVCDTLAALIDRDHELYELYASPAPGTAMRSLDAIEATRSGRGDR